LLHLEANIAQSPKLLDLIALNDLIAAKQVSCLSHKVSRLASDDIPQRRVILALSVLMPDQIALGQIFDGNNDVRHAISIGLLDQVRKTVFHFSKLSNPPPQKQCRNADA
jgi:hypothetical protein